MKNHFRNLLVVGTTVIIFITICHLVPFQKDKNAEQIKMELQEKQALTGCWTDCQFINGVETENGVTRVILDEQANLKISVRMETGPRCRIWLAPEDKISYVNGRVQWGFSTGEITENKTRINFVYARGGDTTRFFLLKNDSACAFLKEIETAVSEKTDYKVPETTSDGWTCAELNSVGMDTSKLIRLTEKIQASNYNDIHAVLIAKNNKLVFEEYFAANGQRRGTTISRHFRERVHHLASTTKCVLSALIGIAVDQQLIRNIDDSIFRYLPDYSRFNNPKKTEISIRNLMTMRAGLRWDQHSFPIFDRRNDSFAMRQSPDGIEYVLSHPIVIAPGTRYNYSNGNSNVLGAILKNATNLEVDEFAATHLFAPLGISNFQWERMPDGTISAAGGLALRPRDLLKIGQLFLNDGTWNSRQIISEKWIAKSTRRHLTFGRVWGYGLHWMQRKVSVQGKEVEFFFHPGSGGQYLAVLPDLKMVVVFTAGNYGSNPKAFYLQIIEKYIVPALK